MMETIRDLLNALSESIRDRLGNPLIGAFLVAWPIWNFRFLLVIFGDLTTPAKIDYIDKHLYPVWESWLQLWLTFPLLSACVFVFAYPFINRWVLTFYKTQQKSTLQTILAIEQTTPLTQEAADKLRRRMKERELEQRSEIEELRIQVDELTALHRDAVDKQNNAISKGNRVSRGAIEVEQGTEIYEETTEKEDETTSDNPLPALLRVSAFQPVSSDFIGVSDSIVDLLTERGLTGKQLAAMYIIRDGVERSVAGIAGVLNIKGYESDLLRDQLIALKVASSGTSGEMKITAAGRQALHAALVKFGVAKR